MGCSDLGSSFVERGLILSGWGDLRGSQERTISSQDGNTRICGRFSPPARCPGLLGEQGLLWDVPGCCCCSSSLGWLCWEAWMDGAAAAGVWVLQLTQCVFQLSKPSRLFNNLNIVMKCQFGALDLIPFLAILIKSVFWTRLFHFLVMIMSHL